jgi:hypothetical protein
MEEQRHGHSVDVPFPDDIARKTSEQTEQTEK